MPGLRVSRDSNSLNFSWESQRQTVRVLRGRRRVPGSYAGVPSPSGFPRFRCRSLPKPALVSSETANKGGAQRLQVPPAAGPALNLGHGRAGWGRRVLAAVSLLSLVTGVLGGCAGPWAFGEWLERLAGLSLLSNMWHLWLPLGLLLAVLNVWARNWLSVGLQLGLALSIALYFIGLKQSATAPDAMAASSVGLRLYALNVGDAVAKWPSVAAEIERLKPDVVALEELNPDMAAGLVETLGERYPHRAVFALGVAGRGLLSRFPIVESGLVEGDGERGILECVLEVEGRRLRVHVVHLSLMSALWGIQEATSRDLLVSVARLKRAAAEEGTPGLLVGDFNSTESSGLYRRLLGLGLVDGYRQGGAGFAFSFPVDYRYPYIRVPMCVRIDHLFLTAGLSVKKAQLGPDAGSDHLPLQAEVWLR